MICPICSNEIKNTTIFCGKCGNRVPRCPSCNAVIRKNSAFCPHDGTKLPDSVLSLLQNSKSVSEQNNDDIPKNQTTGKIVNHKKTQDMPKSSFGYFRKKTIAPQKNTSNIKETTSQEEKKSFRFCIKCGKKTNSGNSVCDNCLNKENNLKESPSSVKYCLKCGNPIYNNNVLCENCRNKELDDANTVIIKNKSIRSIAIITVTLVVLLAAGATCFVLFGDSMKELVVTDINSNSQAESRGHSNRERSSDITSDANSSKNIEYELDELLDDDSDSGEWYDDFSKTTSLDDSSKFETSKSSQTSSVVISQSETSKSLKVSSADQSKSDTGDSSKTSSEAVSQSETSNISAVEHEASSIDESSQVSDDTSSQESEYIFADSNSRYLNKSELSGMSKLVMERALNEIYARHGRKFDTPYIQEYFNSCSWYHGTIAPSDFDASVFNDYEKANIDLIASYMQECGYR